MAFKARKGEIERKLENAKDNLTVFVQRMDETEKQLKPLERQAERRVIATSSYSISNKRSALSKTKVTSQ